MALIQVVSFREAGSLRAGLEARRPAGVRKADVPALWAGHWGALCVACRLIKPPGAKHCRVMDRCYARFDHFCPWREMPASTACWGVILSLIWWRSRMVATEKALPRAIRCAGRRVGNVVARRNHAEFVVALVLAVAAAALGEAAALRRLQLMRLPPSVLPNAAPAAVAFALLAPLYLVPLLALTLDQLRNVAHNFTTNERLNEQRYAYLRLSAEAPARDKRAVWRGAAGACGACRSAFCRRGARNAFDRGVAANCQSFFCRLPDGRDCADGAAGSEMPAAWQRVLRGDQAAPEEARVTVVGAAPAGSSLEAAATRYLTTHGK